MIRDTYKVISFNFDWNDISRAIRDKVHKETGMYVDSVNISWIGQDQEDLRIVAEVRQLVQEDSP